MPLEINVRDDKKTVEVWLSKAEKNNVELRELLQPLYKEYKAKKYLVAVYLSGEGDLFESTRDLLLHYKKVIALKQASFEK